MTLCTNKDTLTCLEKNMLLFIFPILFILFLTVIYVGNVILWGGDSTIFMHFSSKIMFLFGLELLDISSAYF